MTPKKLKTNLEQSPINRLTPPPIIVNEIAALDHKSFLHTKNLRVDIA